MHANPRSHPYTWIVGHPPAVVSTARPAPSPVNPLKELHP